MNRIKSFNNGATCYLVATPIGNLEDISTRALNILNSVEVIACEDTRNTSLLLKHYGISKPLISYHEHNEQMCSEKLINILLDGKSIAMVSDAGYPGISDPGEILVKHCIENNIPVSIIPGGNAFLPALIGSGLATNHFYFHGFLPSKRSARIKELEEIKSIPVTTIFYESPHRIIESLEDIYNVFGDRRISISRELTKLHEEFIRGGLKEVISLEKDSLRGEMVIIVEGAKKEKTSYTDEELIALLEEEINAGLSKKDACRKVEEITKIKKNYLYNLIIKN